MYLSLIFLPFLGSLFSGFFGNFLGRRGSAYFTTFLMFIVFLLTLIVFYYVGLKGQTYTFILYSWVNSEIFNISIGFFFDSLTSIMLIVVCTISFLVHLYSIEYMSEDPHLPRFMSYLSLFTFFMLILVTANNFLQMFVGWEGVGLCSYLLINFWFTRIQANKAAIKAMLMNRIGDFALAFAIFLLIYFFNTLDYLPIFSVVPNMNNLYVNFFSFDFSVIEIICFFLFLGAVGKSAQLGLHTWLPDAMEGPTPVSALIHAATMVTAGVFLIARCSPLFEYAPSILTFITLVGGLTAFFAATTGLLQNDLKKVIAYSTCSQLGYMIFACGTSSYAVAIFHLANHAFFKALLFLGAGSVIHGTADEQDMRKMGGLKKLLPFTYSMIFIGSLALMGFPFLTGFYSKDVILESSFANYTIISHMAYFLGTSAAFFTAFYSIRLIYLTFLSEPNGKRIILENAHESNWKMLLPLGFLAIPSIFIGYLTKDFFIGMGTSFWGTSIFVNPLFYTYFDSEFIPFFYKILPLIFSLCGTLLAYFLYMFFRYKIYSFKLSLIGRAFYSFLNKKWYIDRFYNQFISQKLLNTGLLFTYHLIDRGLIEILGPLGFVKLISKKSFFLTKIQSGYLQHYTFIILLSICTLSLFFYILFFNLFNFF